MTKRGLTNTAGTIVAGALLAACGVGEKGEKPAPVTGVTPVVHATRSEGVINGTLLYSTEPRPGHLVEFYDFGDGATAVHESFPMDIGGTGIMEDKADPVDLASVFHLLNPKTAIVPDQILAADLRAKQAAEAHAKVRADNAKINAPISELPPEPSSLESGDGQLLSATNCSDDFYGDNWGVEWFYSNVCNERNIRICHTNKATDTYTGKSSSLRYKQMEGDFNVAGHMTGLHWTENCCLILVCDCGLTQHTDFDLSVRPRHVEMFTYTTSAFARRITATSPCGHAHTAALHN